MSETAPSSQVINVPSLDSIADMISDMLGFERFTRLNKFYLRYLESTSQQPLSAEERRTLLKLVRDSLSLIEPADIALQQLQELIQQAKGPELAKQLSELITSKQLSSDIKNRIKDPETLLQLAEDQALDLRAGLASERERLEADLQLLEGGQRPHRVESDPLFIFSDDALLGAGVTLLVGGAAIVTAAVLAPVAVPAVVVLGATAAGGFLARVGIGTIAAALVD
jgi:hypothetical protein